MVTWNIKTFGQGRHKNIPFLVKVLHRADPDVIVIQEVMVDPAIAGGAVFEFLTSMERLGYNFVNDVNPTGPNGEYPVVLYRRLWRGGWTATLPEGAAPRYWGGVVGPLFRQPWEVEFDLVKAGHGPRHVLVVHVHLANPAPQHVPAGQLNALYQNIGPHLQL